MSDQIVQRENVPVREFSALTHFSFFNQVDVFECEKMFFDEGEKKKNCLLSLFEADSVIT